MADIELRFFEFNGPDPVAFVLAKNVYRLHHDYSREEWQRCAAEMRRGGESYRAIGRALGVSHEEARKLVNESVVNELTTGVPVATDSVAGDSENEEADDMPPAFSPMPTRVKGSDGKSYQATRTTKQPLIAMTTDGQCKRIGQNL